VDVSLRRSSLQAALAGLENGHAEVAERICRDLVTQDPDDVQPLLLFGLALGISGKPQKAAPILNRVGALRREFAHPCTHLARLMATQAKTRLVVPQYQACLVLTPDDRRLRFGLADWLREQGDGRRWQRWSHCCRILMRKCNTMWD
jgi:hypothetical protein